MRLNFYSWINGNRLDADVSLCNLLRRYPEEAFRKRQDFGRNKYRPEKQQG